MHCLCRPSRIMSVRINLLDETDFIHEIKVSVWTFSIEIIFNEKLTKFVVLYFSTILHSYTYIHTVKEKSLHTLAFNQI